MTGGAVFLCVGIGFAIVALVWLARFVFLENVPLTVAALWGREVPGKVVEVVQRYDHGGRDTAKIRVSFERLDGTRSECGGNTSDPAQMNPGAKVMVRYWPRWERAATATGRRRLLLSWSVSLLVAAVFVGAATVALWDGGAKLGWW